MLSILPEGAGEHAMWLDLLSPTDAERAKVEALTGLTLPSRAALSEIETSSRIRVRHDVLYMSVPSAAPPQAGERAGQPIGFILSRERLVTVRYTSGRAFDEAGKMFDVADNAPSCSLDVFVAVCEEIVDLIADGLEHLAEQLVPLSEAAFHTDDVKGKRAIRSNEILRRQLRTVGRLGDRLSEVRDSLIGLTRIIAFTSQNTVGWAEASTKARLSSLERDVASLNDYDAQLFNKIQFLLDATVGLISIAQNDVFKVLTIVSIVGIPPTLIAGIYGMNFKNMPEYDWSWGYQWGLFVIVASAVIPLIWFKLKRWF
ncbi:MAG TPA: magnesium transporter CorA family protein [Caulobacteraceae bacterium]|jgi:magnesium transporter|nr:magnesium transporter CorA family protein [Caulobacteraceae bacterium]